MEEEETVTDTFIRAVAAEVKGHDAGYEETLKQRERNNPKYAFLLRRDVSWTICDYYYCKLTSIQHRRHAFYRGLVESEVTLNPEFDDEVSRYQISANVSWAHLDRN